jgi:hypothetical protein
MFHQFSGLDSDGHAEVLRAVELGPIALGDESFYPGS